MRKNITISLVMMLVGLMIGTQASASIPSGYYNNAMGKSDRALMAALHQIINGHTKKSYSAVWTAFKTTDCNGSKIIDRYSTSSFTYSSDQCGSYSTVGDCYNREHSVPNSWWGGTQDTMYCDIFHLYPTDGYVNGIRSNYPFGDCDGGTTYGTGKLGTCTYSGYSGTVFEPADEYKGDFARTYFYMATRYMTKISNWTKGYGNAVFAGNAYPGLTTWAINQLLEWHRNDPVSTLETTRNDAVYSIQGNRNPFIDHPELAEYIWGNKTGNSWSGSSSDDDDDDDPVLTAPSNGSTINVGTIAASGSSVSKTVTVSGSNLTKALTVSVSGSGFSVTPTSLTAANANNGTTITITYSGTATSATGTLTISSSEVSTTCTLTAGKASSDDDDPEPSTGDETIETWEDCTTGGYWTKSVAGKAWNWTFSNAGIWEDDNSNDELSCRFGKNSNSYIEMEEDATTGASKISFYAAIWSSDASNTTTVDVLYSTDSGSTWTTLGTTTLNSTWQQYSYTLNVTGNVRFKFQQTAGKRFNIDDIAITSNTGSVTTPTLITPEDGSTIDVGTIAATGSEVSKTISVSGSDLSKNLTIKVSGTGFSVSPTTLTAANVNNGTTITITYASSEAGQATGTLTIGSSEVSATINLTASKEAAPEVAINGTLTELTATQNEASSIAQGSVVTENNTSAVTLSVEGNFEISLDQEYWASTLTLDASGETFYVRLANTATAGEYNGSLTATAGTATAYADVAGVVSGAIQVVHDINMDGTVDVNDITTLIAYVLGEEPSPCDVDACDVNGDGGTDINDVTALIAYILGNESAQQAKAWTALPAQGGIAIHNETGEVLEVYTLDADLVASTAEQGVSHIDLPTGIYLVSGTHCSQKVVIK